MREERKIKAIKIAAFAINAALYVTAGIIFYSVLPLSFGPVRFWPQAVIPAIFATVFGPWVGGLGAGLGIFLNDVILNGNPLLSLMAGVTSNFVGFWLVGYIARRRVRWSTSIVAYGLVTALLMAIAYAYTDFIYVILVAVSYAIFVTLALLIHQFFSNKWQSFLIGAVTGLLVGSAIIGLMVPVYFQYFAPVATPLTLGGGLAYFIWTFTTEIGFMLTLGPPIIAVIYMAFPAFRPKETQREQK
ncbi:MAG: ECF transporter S component [Candidatus Bathyarchaeota archaeon]|nr:ECF transporter S component [Candidatus Bathyarchaeota archaeon]